MLEYRGTGETGQQPGITRAHGPRLVSLISMTVDRQASTHFQTEHSFSTYSGGCVGMRVVRSHPEFPMEVRGMPLPVPLLTIGNLWRVCVLWVVTR